ncbi:MAG: sensor histidine kinase [Actinobacteria bacterium]|nr:sensor histidine kinase [Actinomycetota bacterium]MCB8998258.1 sensor histidine kinase [Actinomycetota bacterium]MCB9415564.1 sensor histidine kinase [Actinomycetota bacterium]HRY08942.1 sensor histidine kinase [Candidatus Nanopelagicales bacterium]
MPKFAEGGVVRREVLAFAIPGFILLGLLAAISFWVARDVAQEESVRDAVVAAQQAEQWAVGPHVSRALEKGDPEAVAQLDEVVRERLLDDPVVTVRLWSSDGTIVYSDKPPLIGQRFDLGDEELEVLNNGGVEAEVSDLSKPENRFERSYGELIEVYLPVQGEDGSRFLLEVYTRQAFLEQQTQRLVIALAPTVVGALAVLALILLLLAWRMARRLDRDRQHREDLLLYAVNSSEAERRRIAADLHDGVVQDLAGVSFGLSALANRAEDPGVERQLTTAADRTRKAVGSLRTLLVDIYPPNLRDAGLGAALQDLGNGLDAHVELDMDGGLHLDDTCQQAFYRVARESTQNIAKHSGATAVSISLTRVGDQAVLTVTDNGRGFLPTPAQSGHVGLTLMQDLATQLGGDLTIESAPGQGTTVRFGLGCGT